MPVEMLSSENAISYPARSGAKKPSRVKFGLDAASPNNPNGNWLVTGKSRPGWAGKVRREAKAVARRRQA